MKLSQKEIAESFSNGNFELTFPYLSENIVWNVAGENVFNGIAEVIESCKQTSEYFKSIETDFKTEDIIAAERKVIVRGTAEFIKDAFPFYVDNGYLGGVKWERGYKRYKPHRYVGSMVYRNVGKKLKITRN